MIRRFFGSTLGGTVTDTFVLRLNSGGGSIETSMGQFMPDSQYVTGGNTFTTGNSIQNTTDPELYQSERWGECDYLINVPSGDYLIRLHFAEIGGSATRKFDVLINNVLVLEEYNITTESGGLTFYAIIEEFNISSSGEILIKFVIGSDNNPKISGIEIIQTA